MITLQFNQRLGEAKERGPIIVLGLIDLPAGEFVFYSSWPCYSVQMELTSWRGK